MNIQCLWQGPADLGEGPLWHPTEACLYWIDILTPTLYRLDPTSNDVQSWKLPDNVGCIAPHHEGGLIAADTEGLLHIQLPSGETKRITSLIKDDTRLRFNDGKCDRQGRFWFGTAPVGEENFIPIGKLYCAETDGNVSVKQEEVILSNGLGWSPDNTVFYYTDSPRFTIYSYQFDAETGAISDRQEFVKLPQGNEVPDGLTVDRDGYVWSAIFNGGRIVRYAPDGSEDKVITMPVSRPTSLMFGGENLSTLYITSCSKDFGETEDDRLYAPAGALFSLEVDDTAGIAEGVYGANSAE